MAPLLAEQAERVADVGCGYMKGTKELLKHHRLVYAVDTYKQRARITPQLAVCERNPRFAGYKSFDAFQQSKLRLGGAYIVNVLHTLPSVQKRVEVLEAANRNLRKGGFVLVDVPSYEHYYSGKMTESNRHGDGYLFRRGSGKRFTFYRFSTREEVDTWGNRAGLKADDVIYDNHHIVWIFRKP